MVCEKNRESTVVRVLHFDLYGVLSDPSHGSRRDSLFASKSNETVY